MRSRIHLSVAGGIAGMVNGILGAGGGMVLVPMLGKRTGLTEEERFPASVAIIAPICIVSLLISNRWNLTPGQLVPYLLGSALGGIAAGIWGRQIPTTWLHRIFGILILSGGIRNLC